MSLDGSALRDATDNGLGNITTVKAEHPDSLNRDGKRSVLAVLTIGSTTVTGITVEGTGAPGGWTAGATYTAQSRTLSLFSKTCDASEPFRYDVTMSAPIPAGVANRVLAWMADFVTAGDPIRTQSFADGGSGGSSLTFASLTAVDADDIWAMAWDNPDNTNFGQLHADSPLTWTGLASAAGGSSYTEDATESWQSSSPTGTRSFTVNPGDSYEAAIGVMVLVGGAAPTGGGWGVGMVRMGAN